MTPVRAAAVIRGDVPGLLRRGMPVINAHRQRAVIVEAVDPAPDRLHELAAIRIDYTDPAALYLSLHWLADRGHLCGWMLPTTHGGRVEAWDGLTAWEVSAIVVSSEVALRAAGRPGIRGLGGPWRHPKWSNDVHMRVLLTAAREGYGLSMVRDTDPYGEERPGWTLQPLVETCWSPDDMPHGPEIGDAGKLAADTAALTDGCCLQVPGGLLIPE